MQTTHQQQSAQKINFQKTKIELDNLEECKGFFAKILSHKTLYMQVFKIISIMVHLRLF